MAEISPAEIAAMARIHAQNMGMEQRATNQAIAKESYQSWADDGAFDAVLSRFRSLAELEEEVRKYKIKAPDKKEKMSDEEGNVVIEEVGQSDELAHEFARNNPELQSQTLLILRSRLSPNDSPETILKKVLSTYTDYSLADEALEFLANTTQGALKEKVLLARSQFMERFQREIQAGRNIAAQAREFSTKGLGEPTALRDLYRDVTGNIRTPTVLFQDLFAAYSYEKMKPIIEFLLSSLGADIRSKGPSIERAELTQLVGDTRSLQAILGIYYFFEKRMSLIYNYFQFYGCLATKLVTFDLLSRQFIKAIEERYPSPAKFRALAKPLGIHQDLAAEIVVFTQMRDAVRRVAPKLYKTERHRQSVLKTWIELLQDLEEEYDEELEEE